MTLGGAFLYYVGRGLLFAIIAGVGIVAGIFLRKKKNAKND